jgi:transcription elongation factor Elf1
MRPVQSDGATNSEPSAVAQWTEIRCPRCGKRTGTEVQTGKSRAYCRRCGIRLEVDIHVIKE